MPKGSAWPFAARLAPHELVGAEEVRLDPAPGGVGVRRPLVDGSDAALPVVARDEVAAGPAQDRQARILQQADDVGVGALHVIGRIEQHAVDDELAGRAPRDAQAVKAVRGEVVGDDELPRESAPFAREALHLGGRGRVGRSVRSERDGQAAEVARARHDAPLEAPHAVQGQVDELRDPLACARDLDALGAPGLASEVGAGVWRDAHGLALPLLHPGVGQRGGAGFEQALDVLVAEPHAGGPVSDALGDAVRVHDEADPAVGRRAGASEGEVVEGGVPEDLGLHAVVDIRAQVLAELARDVGRDGVRRAPRGVHAHRRPRPIVRAREAVEVLSAHRHLPKRFAREALRAPATMPSRSPMCEPCRDGGVYRARRGESKALEGAGAREERAGGPFFACGGPLSLLYCRIMGDHMPRTGPSVRGGIPAQEGGIGAHGRDCSCRSHG